MLSTVVMRPALLFLAALVLAGCGGEAEPKRVPDLRGERLDVAESRLEARGLDWEEIGGGNLGIVIRSHWYVCAQEPPPGKKGTTVRLVVERSCPDSAFLLPNLVGMNLEEAEDELDGRGIPYYVEPRDGGTPRVEHLWTVCSQIPGPGQRASAVRLYVGRLACD